MNECISKCNLVWQRHYSSLSSVSHDPSEIILICWFDAQETFIICIDVENNCAASYFCGKKWFYIFPGDQNNPNRDLGKTL